jgi:hypothetical protein
MEKFNGMFLVFTGLVLTIMAVAGIEASTNDQALIGGFLVSLMGGLILACGVLMLDRVDDRR